MPERRKVLELVQRHGWNVTAFQTLEPGYRYHFQGGDACVAYVDTPAAWVAAGAPIAGLQALAETADGFVRAARAAGKRACFFATEARFERAAGGVLRSLRIGQQPSWDPGAWSALLKDHRSLREQLRRARAKGVVVRPLHASEIAAGPIHDAIEALARRWLGTRGLPAMGFLVRLQPFTFPEHRACFVAELDQRIVGFAGVIPVPARNGFFLEDLVRDPTAPNGTTELLVDAVMRWAAGAGSAYVTLGLAPLAGDVSSVLRLLRHSTAPLYDFEGLHRYKSKLRPTAWTPIHLTYPSSQTAVASVVDSLSAFTDGGFMSFAMRTLRRLPRHV